MQKNKQKIPMTPKNDPPTNLAPTAPTKEEKNTQILTGRGGGKEGNVTFYEPIPPKISCCSFRSCFKALCVKS